jgi:septal ring factor EnvC (AmiA/AmiB activator)
MAIVEERVDRLEEALQAFARDVTAGFKEVRNAQLRTERELQALKTEMSDFKDEMRDFKDEMSDFKDEMRGFKDEMSDFKDEMSDFKDEMRGFKDEMSDFKDEMRGFKDEMQRAQDRMDRYIEESKADREQSKADRRKMTRQWGELANRLGTVVEDIVAPNLPRVAKELFDCEVPELFGLRVRKHFDGETREYDALVACPDTVLVNETKSRLISAHVDGLLDKLAEYPRVFPEHAGRHLVGVLASLYPDPSIVAYATAKGVLVMGMGEETMDVLNPEAVTEQP